MSRSPVVILCFDAMDAATMRSMAAAGDLPAFAALLERARVAPIENPFGFFVHAVWPSFTTGRRADRHRYRNWNEIDPDTYEVRFSNPRDVHGDPFWLTIGDAGRRVAVIDVPHTEARPVNGVQVVEYGNHDRHYGLQSWPPHLAQELVDRFGLHPVFGVDAFVERGFAPDDWAHRTGNERSETEDAALLADFVSGTATKSALVRHVLESEHWDLFVAVFGESHGGGHHFWHHHDPRHPRYDPEVAARLGQPVNALYRSLDDALAEQLEIVDPDATIAVVLSHGMNVHFDANHMLEEMVRRLDAVARGATGGRLASRVLKATWRALPTRVRRRAGAVPAAIVRAATRGRELPTSWVEVTAADRAASRYFMEPNNSVFGGVRLNLVGREPSGTVEPRDAAAVLDQLTDDLLDIVNVATGRPVVRAVYRTDDYYERGAGECMPDLLVDWARDAPVETVWSPKVGLLHGPYGLWRSGDHTPGGLLLVAAPDVEPGEGEPIGMIDIGPSIAARLGVELGDVDGHAVEWLGAPDDRLV